MPEASAKTRLKIILHIVFFLSGVATVLIGQVLPILARQFSLSDLQVSYFFPAQFAGSLLGTFLTGRFARRGDQIMAAVVGGFAMTLGLLLMNIDILQFCLVGFFVNGIGIGLTLPSINMKIVELNPQRSGAALSILNFCWGVGAIVSKPFVDALSTTNSVGLTTIILAVAMLLPTLLLVVTKKDKPIRENKTDDVEEDIAIWTMPLAWMIALFNFIHVGFESGIGGWLTTYTERVEGGATVGWLSPTLLFFSFFVIGRGIAPLLFKRLDETKMLFLGLAIVLVGVVTVLFAKDVSLLSIGACLAGFGTSWIFPANVSRFSHAFGQAAIRKATPLFICGTLGATFVTWLIGYVSDATGNLRSGMFVLVASIVLLIALQTVLSMWQHRKVNSRESH
jgi:MFS transporter, FHS family, glucose/mannose:H+ symporter